MLPESGQDLNTVHLNCCWKLTAMEVRMQLLL